MRIIRKNGGVLAILLLGLAGQVEAAPPGPLPGAHPLSPVKTTTTRNTNASDMSSAASQEEILSPQEKSGRATIAAVEKQKEAARRQTGVSVPTNEFFTVSWLNPVSVAPPPVFRCDALKPAEIDALITGPAKNEAVSPELIRSVIRHESAGVPCAVSDKGAIGLMQLMPEVADQFGVDPYNPKQNVEGATKYLKILLSRYKGDLKLALSAYNAGSQRVDDAGQVPAIPETMAYVEAILRDLGQSPAAAPAGVSGQDPTPVKQAIQ